MSGGGGAGGGNMGRGGGPDAGSMDAGAFGGTSSRDKDVQEAKNQLMGVISVEEAQRNPQNAIATPRSPTGYVSKYGGYGIAKGIESSLIGAGVLDPKYGPTAPAVVVGGFNPGFGPHYDGPIKDISGANTSSPGKIAPFGIDTENVNYNPWGVNPKQENSPAIPEEEIDLFGLDFFDDVLAPIGSAALGNLTTKAALDAFKNSTLGQLVGPQTAGNLATGVGVSSGVYGMGQALKNALEGAGFNVTEEGPSKKGEIPGADVGPSMDLNFKGMESVSVDPIGNAVLDLSRSFASNYDNPVAYNNAVIDAINNLSAVSTAGGDPTANVAQREASERRAAAAKVAAQKAAEALIAQEAARNNNIVNIPVAEGPPVNVKVPTRPKRPKQPTRGREAANATSSGPSPIQIAAASIVADQNKFKTLPKRIQKELRSGKEPTGSDYDVDRALALLKPPAPPPPRPGTRAFIEGGYGR